MTDDPRTQDEIYRSIRDRLTSSIAGLTNFTERSFNYIFTQAYASELRELELQAVAARLSGKLRVCQINDLILDRGLVFTLGRGTRLFIL